MSAVRLRPRRSFVFWCFFLPTHVGALRIYASSPFLYASFFFLLFKLITLLLLSLPSDTFAERLIAFLPLASCVMPFST
ncbi:hypothetical protein J3F83DRAFT_725687 [Trichoderma novae-zelandiae]